MIVCSWDVRRLIDQLGGPDGFSRQCEQRGYGSVPTKTVRKWLSRGRIPSRGLAAAALLLSSQRRAMTSFVVHQERSGA